MSERETYETGLEKLRQFGSGVLKEEDFFPARRAPYRHAILKLDCVPADKAVELAGAWMQLALDVGGYLTVNTHRGEAHLQISVTRPLDDEEIGDDEMLRTRPVPVTA
jgi:hypothetical protein